MEEGTIIAARILDGYYFYRVPANADGCTYVDNKEKKAPDALLVSLRDGEETLCHRPSLGWTVDEAWILLLRSIYSLTVQPWVGRWSILLSRPWRWKVIPKQYWFVAQEEYAAPFVCHKVFLRQREYCHPQIRN